MQHRRRSIRLPGYDYSQPGAYFVTISLQGREALSAPTPRIYPLSEIVRAFKSFSARRINAVRQTPGTPVWQRSYYEHIIRTEQDHQQIHHYIQANPANWDEDSHPR